MHRIDGPGATDTNTFTEGDPSVPVPATVVTADWMNAVQEEITGVIEGAGLTLSKPDNGQLLEAIQAIIADAVANISVPDPVDYLEYRDEKAAGTDGGGFTSGAWQTRTLNTEHSDAGSHGSLASNQITLAAGTYVAEIRCPAQICGLHQARLRNITDGATTLVGNSMQHGTGSSQSGHSVITGRFTIAAPKVFEVQHRCQATRNTDGFGSAVNFGEAEVYTVARFWKVG